MKKYIHLFILVANFLNAQNNQFIIAGRVEKLDNNKVMLIGPASSVSFDFKGDSCFILLQSADDLNQHNYVSLELDGKYIGRLKVEKGAMKSYPIEIVASKKTHHLSVFKATEAANGLVLFGGTTAKIIESKPTKSEKRIELIGDSITCGLGNDTSSMPCGEDGFRDQENAYWSYGAVLARNLDVDFELSSVSGYGIYRNWNDEHLDEAIIPDVYENLYLNKDSSKPYDFTFQPDIVSICLGTNDLSTGDGTKPRLPFNEQKFISNYIQFIKTVYKHTPNCSIVLLSSPMVLGENNVAFISYLKKVAQAFENDTTHKPIILFEFQPVSIKGCLDHPDMEGDVAMAEQLTPLYKKLLNEMSNAQKN